MASGQPQGDVKCECNIKAACFQVKKQNENHGRWFYTCQSRTCRFFQWADGQPSKAAVGPGGAGGGSGGSASGGGSGGPALPWARDGAGTSGQGARSGAGQAASPLGGRPLPNSFGGVAGGTAGGGYGRPFGSPLASPASARSPRGPTNGVTVRLQLVDHETFGANSLGWSDKFVAAIRSLDSSVVGQVWDAQARVWKCRMTAYQLVVDHLGNQGFEVLGIPVKVREIMAGEGVPGVCPLPRSQQEVDAQLAQNVPAHTLARLFPFQRLGVEFIVKMGGRTLLADEMGLGKTVQACVAVAALGAAAWPLLIVCPSALRFVWAAALREWLPASQVPRDDDLWVIDSGKQLEVKRKQGIPTNKRHVCITSYDLVQKMGGLESEYNFVICDESHALKNRTAKRTGFIGTVVKAARYALLITGTPLLSRPIEAWPQIDMLRPGLAGTYWQFGERYCVNDNAPSPHQGGRGNFGSPGAFPGAEFRGANNLLELHALLGASVMLRRTKADVAGQLPDKIRQKVPVELDASSKKAMSKLLSSLEVLEQRKTELGGGDHSEREREALKREHDAVLGELYRSTGPAKVREGVAFVHELLTGREDDSLKLLLFAHHGVVLDAYEEQLCKAHKLCYMRIDGSTPANRREEAVEKFQKDAKVRVALLSINAAGAGLTLTAAQACVFAELVWTPALLLQCEDRAHRIGQTGASVTCFYLLAGGSADDIMWPTVNRKLQVVGSTLDGSAGAGVRMESGAGGASALPTAASPMAAARGAHARAHEEAMGGGPSSQTGHTTGPAVQPAVQHVVQQEQYDPDDELERQWQEEVLSQQAASQPLPAPSQQAAAGGQQGRAGVREDGVIDLTQEPPQEDMLVGEPASQPSQQQVKRGRDSQDAGAGGDERGKRARGPQRSFITIDDD